MTLPRNRNVGSFADIDRGHARFDNPTSNPRLLPKNQQNRERELPDLVLKIRAEWIKAGKFASEPHAESLGFSRHVLRFWRAVAAHQNWAGLLETPRARACAGHPRLTLGSN
jgi:hypothetical protein